MEATVHVAPQFLKCDETSSLCKSVNQFTIIVHAEQCMYTNTVCL